MWPIVFTLLAVLALGIALNKIIKINADPKSKVTAICFLLISIINLAGYWSGVLGVFTMAITVALLITAAYFARYMQNSYIEGN